MRDFLELLLALGSASLVFLGFVLLGRTWGLTESTLATLCQALAIFTGALVAFRAFQLNRKTAREPWSVIFRELHKEFWNDAELARVRTWLCSDTAYTEELLPILQLRKSATVDKETHLKLEALDKYCALMVRVSSLPTSQMTNEQRHAFEALGYHWWLYKTTLRQEIHEYIQAHWKNLAPLLPTSPPKRAP